MSETILTVVMSYDISRPATRRRVAKLLQQRMVRVQQSVFEARVSRRVAEQIFSDVEALLEEEDSLRMYVLTKAGLERSRVSGGAPLPEDGGYWLL